MYDERQNSSVGASFALVRFVRSGGRLPTAGDGDRRANPGINGAWRGLGETRGVLIHSLTSQDECWEGYQVFPGTTSSVRQHRSMDVD